MPLTRLPSGIQIPLADERFLTLQWYSPGVLRVHAGTSLPTRPSLAVVAQADPHVAWEADETDGTLTLKSDVLTVQVNEDGRLCFLKNGKEFLRENGRGYPANDLPNEEDREGAEQRFVLQKSDALYGLGQYQDKVMNRRNSKLTLIHGNVSVVVPFLISNAGWGILWDNASHTEFEDNAEGMRLWSEVGDGVDYYLCVGDNAQEVIAGYRLLSGDAPLFPRGFYGFIQCKERYKDADELVSIVSEHRRREIPLDVIVQDWRYWGEMNQWSSMVYDPELYGDLPGAIQRIHDMHALLMISIWPVTGPDADLHKELDDAGYLFPTIHWSSGKIYDAYNPDARAIYWKHAKKGLFDLGVDAWWMDGTEPEFEDCHDPFIHKASLHRQPDTAAGSWARVLNGFSLATTTGVYEGQREASDDKRVFILSRSAYAGQQRNGTATWSGDISSSWDTLAKQIPAGLNFCAAGIPYWTTDNGAFFIRGRGGMFPGGCKDPAFREFFLRWTQYSVFCPLMRSHGTQAPREVWQFGEAGEEVYDGLVDAIELRMRLLPYSYSLAHEAWANGGSPMLPLGLHFPDAQANDIADQFMYGPALMACPVIEPMVCAPTEHIDALSCPQAHNDGKNGSRRRIFDGGDATEPVSDQHIYADMDFTWSGNNPPGVTSDSYRILFSGDLRRKPAMPRKMSLRVAGRVRLTVGGKVLVDDWQDAPSRNFEIELPVSTEEELVPYELEYGHTSGDAVLKFGYELKEKWELSADKEQVRDVYLPQGDWFDFYSNESFSGGRIVSADAPLSRIPVFVPAGSILPLGPVKQWQDEIPEDRLEICIYPGLDASFTLHEDAGNSYAYERGERSSIPFLWNEKERTLTVGSRNGEFPGMLRNRTFDVLLIGDSSQAVTYSGDEVSVTFSR